MTDLTGKNLINLRKLLKDNLNSPKFMGHQHEWDQIFNLLKTTIVSGESNSALLIGPRSSGKTTLISNILRQLEPHFKSEAVLVNLHGLVHTDDRLALKSIATQMQLENSVDGKVFGSFADNLSFLLACLKSGQRSRSKSVIFVIEEFDLFCSHHNQTILYNLFDISQSAQTPVCVLGITCRLDVIELLEKRVKSRFSHRQYFLFLGKEDSDLSQLEYRMKRLKQLLVVPISEKTVTGLFRKEWNSHVFSLLEDPEFEDLIERLLDLDLSERTLKNILIVVISRLNDDNPKLTLEAFAQEISVYEKDDLVQVLQDLSVLELCLIIAMKHHCEIYDSQPMNFEMVLTRYVKFAHAHASVQSVQRGVIMKAFEHIQNLELISTVGGSRSLQKEYQLFRLLVLPEQIMEAVKKSPGLPTEVVQWANSSFV